MHSYTVCHSLRRPLLLLPVFRQVPPNIAWGIFEIAEARSKIQRCLSMRSGVGPELQ